MGETTTKVETGFKQQIVQEVESGLLSVSAAAPTIDHAARGLVLTAGALRNRNPTNTAGICQPLLPT
jgi:hypothetical protein